MRNGHTQLCVALIGQLLGESQPRSDIRDSLTHVHSDGLRTSKRPVAKRKASGGEYLQFFHEDATFLASGCRRVTSHPYQVPSSLGSANISKVALLFLRGFPNYAGFPSPRCCFPGLSHPGTSHTSGHVEGAIFKLSTSRRIISFCSQ